MRTALALAVGADVHPRGDERGSLSNLKGRILAIEKDAGEFWMQVAAEILERNKKQFDRMEMKNSLISWLSCRAHFEVVLDGWTIRDRDVMLSTNIVRTKRFSFYAPIHSQYYPWVEKNNAQLSDMYHVRPVRRCNDFWFEAQEFIHQTSSPASCVRALGWGG